MTDTLTAEQIKIFYDTTNSITASILEKKIDITIEKLFALIKEVYQYALKSNPPCVDEKFADWLLDKYKL